MRKAKYILRHLEDEATLCLVFGSLFAFANTQICIRIRGLVILFYNSGITVITMAIIRNDILYDY